jgi:hypothetical protein
VDQLSGLIISECVNATSESIFLKRGLVLPSNQGTSDDFVAAGRAAYNIHCILIYGGDGVGCWGGQREVSRLEFGID